MIQGKTKTITIDHEIHKKIKIFCAQNGLRMNEWTEKIFKEAMKIKNNKKDDNN